MGRIIMITGALLIGLASCKTMKDGASSDKITKASVTYDLEFSSDDPNVQAQLGMMQGSEFTMTFAGDNSKTEMKMGSVMTNTTIINGEEKKGLMLMSGMVGNKAVPMSEEEINENKQDQSEESDSEESDVEVEKTGDTKEIAGYNCEKVIITTEKGDAMIMWVTDEIKPSRTDGRFIRNGIGGFPLAMDFAQNGVELKFQAKEVKTKFEKKEKDIFSIEVPEGYEVTTMDAIQGMGM